MDRVVRRRVPSPLWVVMRARPVALVFVVISLAAAVLICKQRFAATVPINQFDVKVTQDETARWQGDVANGGRVVFAEPSHSKKSESADVAGAGGRIENVPATKESPIGSMGRLTVQQKATALSRLAVFLNSAQEHYAAMPFGTPQEQAASLNQAMDVVLYESARQVVSEDQAWAFIRGQGDISAAWRMVPRNWEKIKLSNAAQLDDGKMIDLVIPIDPDSFPAIASLREQRTAAETARIQELVANFNVLPLDQRRSRILSHLEAAKALSKANQLSGAERHSYESKLLDPGLRIDEVSYYVSAR